jgi:hypothetical protein
MTTQFITQDQKKQTVMMNNNARNATKAMDANTKPKKCCPCYNEDSTDTRCFGLCYCFCRAKNIDKELDRHRCDICPNDLKEYKNSGYFNTENDELCTVLCLPIKIPLFFICILGSACNNCINCTFKTNRNYLL